jgi:hypothetical protein
MNEHDQLQLTKFLEMLSLNGDGYAYVHLSYLAIKAGDKFVLVQGRLQLQGVPPPHPAGALHFRSPNVRAGIYSLSELNFSPKGLVESLLLGVLPTPDGELQFPPQQGGSHSLYYLSPHPEGTSAQRREARLAVTGGNRPVIPGSELDWEVKASSTPFFNIQELCDFYLVGPFRGNNVNVEIIANNVAAISKNSMIAGTKALSVIDLAMGLDRGKASIGYRIFDKNRVVKRGMVLGTALVWENIDGVQRGKAELEVPAGAIIDCVANYADFAQHHFWIADPKFAQNALRAVHNGFDPNLEVLKELIAKAQNKGNNARDLEIAVAWLLWMLGFSVTHIGATAKTSDAPDLIAVSPKGDFLVVECTVGILKEDSKLSRLHQRAEKIRQSLAACGNSFLKVLPVIATTKTRAEIASDVDQANKLGIAVATIETLPALLDRSLLVPDANRLIVEVEEALRASQAAPNGEAINNQ